MITSRMPHDQQHVQHQRGGDPRRAQRVAAGEGQAKAERQQQRVCRIGEAVAERLDALQGVQGVLGFAPGAGDPDRVRGVEADRDDCQQHVQKLEQHKH
jgi:hypothetical protein